LREYDERGLQATIAIQQAARKVAWENFQLRALLANKGVSAQEITEFLYGRQQKDAVGQPAKPSPPINVLNQNNALHEDQPITDDSTPVGALSPPESDYTSNTSVVMEGGCLDLLPPVSDCFCPPIPPPPDRDDLMLEMPCESAATIIASMRRNGDKDYALSKLGCNENTQCNVKNIKVLQVMEMINH
jgi:hypothetical protein